MSDRQTQKLTTPSGKEVEIKTYLTARERNGLRESILGGVTIDPVTGEPKVAEITGKRFEEMEHDSILVLVISFDGSPDNIVERLLDGTVEDYDFVVAECNKKANFKRAK